MRTLQFVVLFVVVVTGLTKGVCFATVPSPKIDDVLSKWEAASKACGKFDASVVIYRYDSVFSNAGEPTISYGRFYYEFPNSMRFDTMSEYRRTTGNRGTVIDSLIWKGNKTLYLHGKCCQVFEFSKANSPEKKEDVTPGCGFFRNWLRPSPMTYRIFRDPREVFPVIVDIRAAQLRERYSLDIEIKNGDLLLTATPKNPEDKECYRKLSVLINSKTYRTFAIRVDLAGGNDQCVYEFIDQKINCPPSDDRLLNPNLDGFKVWSQSVN